MPAVIPLVLLTLATSAQPASVALEVRGPGGCPGQPWVAARLSQLLQRPAVDPGSARAARLVVIPEGAGLVATVRLDGGERVLRTATRDCPALLDAATLALAVALDPIRGLALQAAPLPPPTPPAPPPPAPPPPAPASPPPAPPAVPVAPPAEATPAGRWWVRLGGHASVGDTPAGLSVGPLLALDRRQGPWGVGLDLRWALPTAAAAPPGEVQADASGLALSGCWHGLDPLGLCVVAAAGLQRAQGLDLPDAQTVWAPLLSAGGRGRLDVPLDDRWSLVGTGDVRAAFSRTVLRVGDGAAWTSWPLWIVGSVGIAARL